MANKTTKTAGTNKSFIDRMGGQKIHRFPDRNRNVHLLLCNESGI